MIARALFVPVCLAAVLSASSSPAAGTPAQIEAAIVYQQAIVSNRNSQMLALDTRMEGKINYQR